MRKAMMIIAAMLALCGGQAMAQRCLPGMSAVEIKADMTDGFYIGSSRDCIVLPIFRQGVKLQ